MYNSQRESTTKQKRKTYIYELITVLPCVHLQSGGSCIVRTAMEGGKRGGKRGGAFAFSAYGIRRQSEGLLHRQPVLDQWISSARQRILNRIAVSSIGFLIRLRSALLRGSLSSSFSGVATYRCGCRLLLRSTLALLIFRGLLRSGVAFLA